MKILSVTIQSPIGRAENPQVLSPLIRVKLFDAKNPAAPIFEWCQFNRFPCPIEEPSAGCKFQAVAVRNSLELSSGPAVFQVALFEREGRMIEPLNSGAILDRVQNNRLQALVRYWNEKRQGRLMPARLEIEPLEIPSLLPIVLLAGHTPAGVTMRLLGTEATNGYGEEMRGRLIETIDFGEFTPDWTRAFAGAARQFAPAFAAGRFAKGAEQLNVELVLMPLSDDGVSVSHFFGGLSIKPRARSGATVFSGEVARYVSPLAPALGPRPNAANLI